MFVIVSKSDSAYCSCSFQHQQTSPLSSRRPHAIKLTAVKIISMGTLLNCWGLHSKIRKCQSTFLINFPPRVLSFDMRDDQQFYFDIKYFYISSLIFPIVGGAVSPTTPLSTPTACQEEDGEASSTMISTCPATCPGSPTPTPPPPTPSTTGTRSVERKGTKTSPSSVSLRLQLCENVKLFVRLFELC